MTTLSDIQVTEKELEAIALRNPPEANITREAIRGIAIIDMAVRLAKAESKSPYELNTAYELIKLKGDCICYELWGRE